MVFPPEACSEMVSKQIFLHRIEKYSEQWLLPQVTVRIVWADGGVGTDSMTDYQPVIVPSEFSGIFGILHGIGISRAGTYQ
jgi:hypothetical protein